MAAKIKKFGTLTEENGVLVFDGFHVDCDGFEFRSKEIALLALTVERLQKALLKHAKHIKED